MKSKKETRPSLLLFAASENNADQLYFGKVFAPDPFLSMGVGKKKYAFVNALEFSRLKKESAFDEVFSLEEWRARAKKRFRRDKADTVEVVRLAKSAFQIREFLIAPDFPAGLAFQLRSAKVPLRVSKGPLFEKRIIKSEAEAKAVREGNAASAAGLRKAEQILRRSAVKKGKLYFEGRLLTSERVRRAIEIACLERGAVATNTIVAGGDQACDPHCLGNGPLRANELIIIDIFPRVAASGYFGDMTRTFLKGRASDPQRRLVAAVQKAQKRALEAIRAGISGNGIHRLVLAIFKKEGYETKRVGDGYEGFFHGTGHGLGLEIHEAPRLHPGGPRLRRGMVVTVEPGLYYPGLGGCRIEDVVQVGRDGADMLSHFHYRWELN